MSVFVQFSLTIVLALLAASCALVAAPRLLARESIQRMVIRWQQALELGWADRILLAQFFGFIVIFSALAILRYVTFHTGYLDVNTSWDLAQYDQIIWNSLHGRLFENSFILDAHTFLGKSFSPILIAFVPLYAVWSSPIVLLVAQTVGIAFSTLPIYWFSRKQVGSWLALVLCTAFLLSPGVENIVLTEFHEIAFATPILALATLFLLKRHYLGLIISLVVALLIKEEIAFIVIAFGIYIFLRQRQRLLGAGIAIFGIVWGATLLQYVIPFFRGAEFGGSFYYFGEGLIGSGGARYGYLGQSIPQIVTTLVTRPDVVLSHVFIPDKIEYLLHLFVPLVFIPLFGAEVSAIALPTLGYSLLSTYGLQYSIHSYYFAPLVPFLFFGSAIGLRRIMEWANKTNWLAGYTRDVRAFAINVSLAVMILVASWTVYFFQSPGPLGGDFQIARYQLNQHDLLGNRLLSLVPDDATAVVQNEYLAHLSHREQIYEVPIPDYREVEYFFADRTKGWFDVHHGHWEYVLNSGYFDLLADQDGYLVGRRVAPEQSVSLRFGDRMTLLGYSTSPKGTMQGGMTFRPIVFWRAETPLDIKYKIAVRVVDDQAHLWAEEDREPEDGALPTDRWQPGKLVGDQYSIPLPPTMPAGNYQVVLRVHQDNGDDLLAQDSSGMNLGGEPTIAQVRIEKDKASVQASDLVNEQPMVALFADMRELRFLGYYPSAETVRIGEPIQFGLYWRARSKPRGDYAVSVQLRDATGSIAFEHTARPANNTYPTLQWDGGEVLLDWHDFQLPPSFNPGKYEVFVVLRDATTSQAMGEIRITTISMTR